MNFNTIIGFLAAVSIFFATVFLSLKNSAVLLDFKSALIVLGGTAAVSVVCFSLDKIVLLIKVFLKRMVGLNKVDYMAIVDEIVLLSNAYKTGMSNFEKAVNQTKHMFLKDAAQVLFWLESDVTPEKLKKLLDNKADTFFSNYMTDANSFRTLAKFPPAFGLMGTTLGMIALLQGLGEEGAAEQIGPSMAIALITTLYGLFVANFLLVPIAENLSKQAQEDFTMRLMIVEGIMLIQEGEPTKYVEESVKSFLLPSEKQKAA